MSLMHSLLPMMLGPFGMPQEVPPKEPGTIVKLGPSKPQESFIRVRPSPAPAETATQPVQVEQLGDRVHLIQTPAGNSILAVTSRHAILVDAPGGGAAAQLHQAVRSLTDKPIKYLINTRHHPDSAGGNPVLAAEGATVIAHAQARARIQKAQERVEMLHRGGLPELILGQPGGAPGPSLLTVHLEGLDFHLYHAGPGHSDSDLTVGIPAANVIHLGSLFTHGMVPAIDLDAGGSLAAMIQRLDEFCSWIPEDAKIVPGRGPLASKNDLVLYRNFLKDVADHVAKYPKRRAADLMRSFDKRKWSHIRDQGPGLTWEMFMDLAAGRQPTR